MLQRIFSCLFIFYSKRVPYMNAMCFIYILPPLSLHLLSDPWCMPLRFLNFLCTDIKSNQYCPWRILILLSSAACNCQSSSAEGGFWEPLSYLFEEILTILILHRQPHLPWYYEFNGAVTVLSRKHHFSVVSYNVWFLQSFCTTFL